jgi:hypothetical protein
MCSARTLSKRRHTKAPPWVVEDWECCYRSIVDGLRQSVRPFTMRAPSTIAGIGGDSPNSATESSVLYDHKC